MTHDSGLLLMLYGGIVAEQLIIVFLFARFWRETKDRLFVFFALAFVVMAVHRVLLGVDLIHGTALEQQTGVYLVRLSSYALLLAGLIDKNQRSRASRRRA